MLNFGFVSLLLKAGLSKKRLIDTHHKNLLTKFEVNNTALLITMAAKFGIV
jgi:DNA-binding CsgD family transcriptional regulator